MTKSRDVSEIPQKPSVAMTRNLQSSQTLHAGVLAYIKTKNDGGDLAAAMMYQPSASGDRLATRMATVEGEVDKALSKIK